MSGTFITFEGIDGSGKSTQLRLLASFLRAQGVELLLTREPGGTPVGVRLREALLDVQGEVDPLTELLVFAADRAQHVRKVIRPALSKGAVLISDRYADATRAYQGAGRGFSAALISEIIELATDGLVPDLTILFDVTVEESTNRTTRRSSKNKRDRLDIEKEDFHSRVREEYLRIAKAEPQRVRVIDATGSIDQTQEQLRAILVPFLQQRGHLSTRLVNPTRHKFKRGHC
ncbi:MAG TPA: dTMP kinase [Pyrinomonadaceae bacterium]